MGEHLYAGDLPHAEQRASLLSLDPTLLGELLGSTDLGDVLDADVIAGVEAGLQRLAPDRRMRGVEGAADLLRVLGPLSVEEAALRMRSDAEADDDGAADEGGGEVATEEEAHALLEELQRAHRAFTVVLGGKELWAAVDDAAFLRDALGATIPPWADALNRPASQSGQAQAPLRDPERSAQREIEGSRAASAESDGGEDALHPLDELLARYARTHGPFSAEAAAARFGIGVAVARDGLARLASAGRLMQGRFGEDGDGRARAWVETGVFRRLRSLSLAEARRAVQAVSPSAFARFLIDLQGAGPLGEERFEGIDGLAQVIAQFEGVFLPACATIVPACSTSCWLQATWCGRALAAKATRAMGMGGRRGLAAPASAKPQASSRSIPPIRRSRPYGPIWPMRRPTGRSRKARRRRRSRRPWWKRSGSEAACSSARSSMRCADGLRPSSSTRRS